jgi:hypothetical protein
MQSNDPNPQPQLYALVNNNSTLMVSESLTALQGLTSQSSRVVRAINVEPAGALYGAPTFNYYNRIKNIVEIVQPCEGMGQDHYDYYVRINRANAYPSLGDQIGAIIKQLQSMNVPLVAEFGDICGKVAEVKTNNPY